MSSILRLAAGIKSFVRGMADDILMIYAEKGIEPFKKPLLLSIPALLVLYNFVYIPLGDRIRARKSALEQVRLIAAHYEDYSNARTRLAGYKRRLPLIKDKDEWLNYVLTATAKVHGIDFYSLSSQTEIQAGNFLLVARTVTVTITYTKLGKWIADIENSPIFLKVAEVTIVKDPAQTGMLKVTMTISTMFPNPAAAAGGK